MPENSQDWTPVASQAVGVFGHVSEPVQLTIIVGLTLVTLAGIFAFYLIRRVNSAVYPDGYDRSLNPGDDGYVSPLWETVDDTSVVERFGFTKSDILAMAEGV